MIDQVRGTQPGPCPSAHLHHFFCFALGSHQVQGQQQVLRDHHQRLPLLEVEECLDGAVCGRQLSGLAFLVHVVHGP